MPITANPFLWHTYQSRYQYLPCGVVAIDQKGTSTNVTDSNFKGIWPYGEIQPVTRSSCMSSTNSCPQDFRPSGALPPV